MNQEDKDLFSAANKGIRPLKSADRLPIESGKKKAPPNIISKSKTPPLEKETFFYSLSSEEKTLVSQDTFLSFKREGISPRKFKQFASSTFPIEASLDLHGYTVDEAREALVQFILTSQKQGLRKIIVVHGKGKREMGTTPLLKNKVNTWLPQMQEVLAFSSCQPKDGGTGAVYVLLRKTPE